MGSRDPVGRTAKCQVTSERKPGFVTRTVVDEIAERLLLERYVIIYFSTCQLLDNGSWSRRTIVEKEIITLYAVFRPVIDHQRFPYPCFSCGIDIQDLFGDFASPHLIFD